MFPLETNCFFLWATMTVAFLSYSKIYDKIEIIEYVEFCTQKIHIPLGWSYDVTVSI
jgi:hypothetical protein